MANQKWVPLMSLMELTSPEPKIRFPDNEGLGGGRFKQQREELAHLNFG